LALTDLFAPELASGSEPLAPLGTCQVFGCTATGFDNHLQNLLFFCGRDRFSSQRWVEFVQLQEAMWGAVSATTATQTGDNVLFNLFCTSTHHVLAFLRISLSLTAGLERTCSNLLIGFHISQIAAEAVLSITRRFGVGLVPKTAGVGATSSAATRPPKSVSNLSTRVMPHLWKKPRDID